MGLSRLPTTPALRRSDLSHHTPLPSAQSPQRAVVLALQATAGNAAAARLVQRPSVQREDAGWKDATAQGGVWNASKKSVGTVDRYPIQLTSGGLDHDGLDTQSAKLTSESAAHRAIALVPSGLKPDQPVTVLLHFHGHVEDASKRPYASWREHVKDKAHPERSAQVRDVAHDRIAQQIEAAGDAQVLGLLPVGVGPSMFSRGYNTFAGKPYLTEVFETLVKVGATKTKIDLDKAQVILGAHSGGGFTLNSMLEAATAEAAGKTPKGLSTAGSRIASVALFEAAIDNGRWKTVWAWVRPHLDRLARLLDSQADPADKAKAIQDAPRLRAYYGASYVQPHKDLRDTIAGWFNQPFKVKGKVTGRKNRDALGPYLDDVKGLFRVIHVPGVRHEEIVRGHALSDRAAANAGTVTDAIKALKDPKAGPIPGLGTVVPPKPSKKAKKATAAPKPNTSALLGSKGFSADTTAVVPAGLVTSVTISWGSNAKQDAVADSSLAVLKDVVRAAGLTKATITSTARSAADQARAMYQNLTSQGVAKQKKLYGAAGDKVIDTFVALRDARKSRQEIKDGMRDKILELGPSRVSRHCGDPKVLNVFDVGPNSLGDDDAKEAFNTAARAEVGVRVSKYIPYPKDPGNHLEIKPSGGIDHASLVTDGASEKAAVPATSVPVPAPTAPAGSQPVAAKSAGALAGWKASNAAAGYELTADERAALAAQTADERAADRNELKAKKKRLKDLRATKRKGPLSAAEATELTGLEALEGRVKATEKLAFNKQDTEEVLKAAGFTVTGWYADVVKGTFLGISLRVHKELAERLRLAESRLVADAKINPKGLAAKDLGTQLGMYDSVSDLRAPKAATGGTKLSLHTFGLAVDLNYAGNIFIGNKYPEATKDADKKAKMLAARTPRLVERAMWLVKGKSFNVEAADAVARRAADVAKAWDAHREASDALVTYLGLAAKVGSKEFDDLVKACGEPKGVKWNQPDKGTWWKDLTWWKQRVTEDSGLQDTYDFSEQKHHGYAAKTGYMDLPKEVVEALVVAGLTWGGQYGGAKDMMHFDWRSGGDAAKVEKARAADEPNH